MGVWEICVRFGVERRWGVGEGYDMEKGRRGRGIWHEMA